MSTELRRVAMWCGWAALHGGCALPQAVSAPLPASVAAVARPATTELSLLELTNDGPATLQVCLGSAVLQDRDSGATCGLGVFGACLDVAPHTTVSRVPFVALSSCALRPGEVRALIDLRFRRQPASPTSRRGEVWRTTTLLTNGTLRRAE